MDDADLPVRPEGRRPTAPQRYRAPGRTAVVHASAIARCVSAPVAGRIAAAIAGGVSISISRIGLVSSAIAGGVSVTIAGGIATSIGGRVSAAIVGRVATAIARRSRKSSRSVPAECPWLPSGYASFHGWERRNDWEQVRDRERSPGPGRRSARDCPHAHLVRPVPCAAPTPAMKSSGMQKLKWTFAECHGYG